MCLYAMFSNFLEARLGVDGILTGTVVGYKHTRRQALTQTDSHTTIPATHVVIFNKPNVAPSRKGNLT